MKANTPETAAKALKDYFDGNDDINVNDAARWSNLCIKIQSSHHRTGIIGSQIDLTGNYEFIDDLIRKYGLYIHCIQTTDDVVRIWFRHLSEVGHEEYLNSKNPQKTLENLNNHG